MLRQPPRLTLTEPLFPTLRSSDLRAMQLLTAAGIEVRETRLTWQDVLEADEVFSTGNYGKVLPVTQVEDRNLKPGPIYATAREAYRPEEHTVELQSLMRNSYDVLCLK